MVLRVVLSAVVAGAVAWLGGMVLGEYPFTGDGIQWLPILGGAGLGAAVAWVVNRIFSGSPPVWMGAVAAALAAWGEVTAVQEDTAGGAWPGEGWAAIVAAGGVALYGVVSAARRAAPQA